MEPTHSNFYHQTDETEAEYGSEFASIVNEANLAIDNEIHPLRIPQGSSGSYFVLNTSKEKIAVFKPKNEEPYGHLNPKWLKWLHKIFFPCCFGRSCLLPNQGYLSEAGASLIDSKLGLDIVPKTGVVSLTSTSFNYSSIDKALSNTKTRINDRLPEIGRHFRRTGLPPKVGSFQLFVNGYETADFWVRLWSTNPLPSESKESFQLQFERMVILDYIIRNTDRGADNWLIKCEIPAVPAKQPASCCEIACFPVKEEKIIDINSIDNEPNSVEDVSAEREEEKVEEWEEVAMPQVKIAAIDNGLAFPFKHPDEWRSYPYGWMHLSMAYEPFSEATVAKILPLLENTDFVLEIGKELRKVFKKDPGFDKKTFGKQLSVMYGQIFNLVHALRQRNTPSQLAQMRPIYMEEIKEKKKNRNKKHQDPSTGCSSTEGAQNLSDLSGGRKTWENAFKQKFHTRNPFFTWF